LVLHDHWDGNGGYPVSDGIAGRRALGRRDDRSLPAILTFNLTHE
jgi:hypothetical protein